MHATGGARIGSNATQWLHGVHAAELFDACTVFGKSEVMDMLREGMTNGCKQTVMQMLGVHTAELADACC